MEVTLYFILSSTSRSFIVPLVCGTLAEKTYAVVKVEKLLLIVTNTVLGSWYGYVIWYNTLHTIRWQTFR